MTLSKKKSSLPSSELGEIQIISVMKKSWVHYSIFIERHRDISVFVQLKWLHSSLSQLRLALYPSTWQQAAMEFPPFEFQLRSNFALSSFISAIMHLVDESLQALLKKCVGISPTWLRLNYHGCYLSSFKQDLYCHLGIPNSKLDGKTNLILSCSQKCAPAVSVQCVHQSSIYIISWYFPSMIMK